MCRTGLPVRADLVIDEEPLAIRVQPHIEAFAGENRLTMENAGLNFPPVHAAQGPLALFEAIGHDLEGSLGRAADRNAARVTMRILHESRALSRV